MSDYIIEKREDLLQVSLAGDLTANIVPGLQTAVREALTADVKELTVDLRNTAMLDSSGIGLLIAAANTLARSHGRIQVMNVSPDILQLLQSMRLVQRLNVTPRAQ